MFEQIHAEHICLPVNIWANPRLARLTRAQIVLFIELLALTARHGDIYVVTPNDINPLPPVGCLPEITYHYLQRTLGISKGTLMRFLERAAQSMLIKIIPLSDDLITIVIPGLWHTKSTAIWDDDPEMAQEAIQEAERWLLNG